MTIRITLTDAELPPSVAFIDFVDVWLSGVGFDGSTWATPGAERAAPLGGGPDDSDRGDLTERISANDEGRRLLARSYELFVALLIGDPVPIRALRERLQFALVVGIPRTGGKYLTKALFRATGHEPTTVPAVLAHDGVPDAGPWRFDRHGNGWVESLHSMAEYLTMAEAFFGPRARARDARPVIVPKKATKLAYAAGLHASALGPVAAGVLTVRHPVATCLSTAGTGGGLPADGRFAVRDNIERFCARDVMDQGVTRDDLAALPYFDVYLRYWEAYHLRLAMSAAVVGRFRIVAYGAERYAALSGELAAALGAEPATPEPFIATDERDADPAWMAQAEPVVDRVADVWERVGLAFPRAEVKEAR